MAENVEQLFRVQNIAIKIIITRFYLEEILKKKKT